MTHMHKRLRGRSCALCAVLPFLLGAIRAGSAHGQRVAVPSESGQQTLASPDFGRPPTQVIPPRIHVDAHTHPPRATVAPAGPLPDACPSLLFFSPSPPLRWNPPILRSPGGAPRPLRPQARRGEARLARPSLLFPPPPVSSCRARSPGSAKKAFGPLLATGSNTFLMLASDWTVPLAAGRSTSVVESVSRLQA